MATLSFSNLSPRDVRQTFKKIPDTHRLKIIINDLIKNHTNNELIFLNKSNIEITSISRSWAPTYMSYDRLASILTGIYKAPITTDHITALFGNRSNQMNNSTQMISHNEFIYKEEIWNWKGDWINDIEDSDGNKAPVKVSAHFDKPGENYSNAFDITITPITTDQIETIIKHVQKTSGIHIRYHAIAGSGNHFHIEDKTAWNSYSDELSRDVYTSCGYSNFKPVNQSSIVKTRPAHSIPKFQQPTPKMLESLNNCRYLTETDSLDYESTESNITVEDARTALPHNIDSNGLMEVLRIGDINFNICPVTQISYSQSMQYVRFSTLRTNGDPKIASDTIPNNVTLNIIFPNAGAINNELKSLLAQFMVTPVTLVQSRFIARTLKPTIIDHTDSIKQTFPDNETLSAMDESLWMVMTDINVRSIPGFPEAYEVFLTLEMFEDRVFGDRMKFLKTKQDVIAKYQKKLLVNGSVAIPPSEKSQIENLKTYTAPAMTLTTDPNNSAVFKDFYGSVKEKFANYDPTEYNSKLEVFYNATDLSRGKIKAASRKYDASYHESLLETQRLLNYTPEAFNNYLAGKGVSVITRSDIKILTDSSIRGSFQLINMAIKQTEVYKSWNKFRYAAVDPIVNLNKMRGDAIKNINQLASQQNLDNVTKDIVLKMFNTILDTLGDTVMDWSNGLSSTGITDVDGNPIRGKSGAAQSITGLGSIGALELLMNKQIFGLTQEEIDKESGLSDHSRIKMSGIRFKNVSESILKLTKLFIPDGGLTDPDGLPTIPNVVYNKINLIDGIQSISTGVSFSMSNKVVAQQVIGWKQATFQHLGRSDWSINMNIVCNGDDTVNTIMYMLNRMGHMSKQIQFTSPAKFVHLDTTLWIGEGDPIFGALGISKMVLNTVEISTIPEKPNAYQISLGMEQADLDVRKMENINELQNKTTINLANDTITKSILPILKCLIIRDDHPNKGKFLDHMRIKEVIENPQLKMFWSILGLNDKDGNSLYDYMDKYNFYKIFIQQTTIKEVSTHWDDLLKYCFPMNNEYLSYIGKSRKLVSSLSRTGLNNTGNEFLNGYNLLIDLIVTEGNGNLIKQDGNLKDPTSIFKLTASMEPYFEAIGMLVNSYLSDLNQKNTTQLIDSDFMSAIGGIIGSIVGGATAAAVANLWNPIGWVLAAVIIVSIAGSTAVYYLAAEEHNLRYKAKELVPKIMPVVFNLIVDAKLRDLAQELIIDDTSLNLFNPNFIINKDENGNVITLQQEVENLRKLISSKLIGCYNDFNEQLVNASTATGLPISILDPAFYLYSNDVITTDLIRELQSDVTSKINLLVTKANHAALMLGEYIENEKILDKDGKLTTEYSFINDSKFINEKDIKWAADVKKRINDLHVKAFTSRKSEDIVNLSALNQDSQITHDVYFSEKWDDYMAEARQDVFIEAAFSRLLLIQSALRHDIIMSKIKKTTDDILSKINETLNAKKSSSTDKDNFPLIEQYKKLFMDKEWGDPSNNKSLYDSIIEYGGTTNPYYKGDSIEKKFLGKEKKTMEKYFTEDLISQIINDIKVIAVCKKASLSSYTAEKMAQLQGLIDDPRMLEKQQTQVQSMLDFLHKASIIDVTSNPIKIFPTYKIYFIEEDAPEWGIYHDFYDYSAIQEITVVKDRESASDTCVIKLSNVTGKLTDTFAENMLELGTQNMPLNSMMLKPGMSILVKVGYDNSQVTLPVVFYGIIVEVQPGPIVEIVCQGYGAELNEVIAPNEGVHHGVFGDVKGLGDVATWALQQSTGLNHFGKMGYSEFGMRDALRLSGTTTSGLQGKMKIASFITGLPGINLNDPKDDNVYLPYNLGNITEKSITGTIDGTIQSFLNKFLISGNPTFDWYIRDQSIWDVIGETVYFSPDFIKTVLPYNDNIFPFIPKIRNTLYVGPKKGYYKYTDMYSIISKDNNVEIPNIGEINNLLFEVSKLLMFYHEYEGRNYRNVSGSRTGGIFKNEKFIQLVDILNNDLFVRKLVFLFFNLSPESNLVSEVSRNHGEMINLIDLVKKYLDRFTNFLSLDLKKSSDVRYEEGEIDKLKIQGDFPSAIKKNSYRDVGMNGIYYNRYGNNHQYKKVQQHHMITSHSNIINNNIQASANGWANRIKLISPPDPGKYTSKNDMSISDREDLVTGIFNLDDDIYDDHIRPKEVFINNIDSSWFDDAIWAKKVLNGESSYGTVMGNKAVVNQKNPETIIVDPEGGDQREKFENKDELDINGETFKRNAWELLPTRWRVGISLLAEEVRNMYNGEVIITGNSYIKPYDIIHLIDYVNDMHGSFEAGRVIHSFTPQTGFITRIKPDLIANQKDKFNEEELFIGSQLMAESFVKAWADSGIGLFKGGALGFGVINTAAAVATVAKVSATAVATAAGIATGVGFIVLGGYLGYKGIKNYHERIIMTMNNIVGRDSIDIMPIMYRNLPYVAGIEGIKKNSYARHMYGKVVDDSGRTSIFERIGYMNAPLEFEFYSKIVGNSDVWSFAKAIVAPGLFSGQGSIINQSLLGGNQ